MFEESLTQSLASIHSIFLSLKWKTSVFTGAILEGFEIGYTDKKILFSVIISLEGLHLEIIYQLSSSITYRRSSFLK